MKGDRQLLRPEQEQVLVEYMLHEADHAFTVDQRQVMAFTTPEEGVVLQLFEKVANRGVTVYRATVFRGTKT